MARRLSEERWNALKSHPDVDVRLDVVQRVARYWDEDTLPRLLEALKDDHWRVRRLAAKSLGKLGDPEAIPALAACLKDKSQGVRRRAVVALGAIGGEEVVGPISQAFRDRKWEVRVSAIDAMSQVGMLAAPTLSRLLSEADTRVTEAATSTLRQLLQRHGGQLPLALLSASALNGRQRWQGLNALCGQGGGWFYAPVLPNVYRFCQQSLDDPSLPVQQGAQSVLDYLTLARASQRAENEPEVLLRAATGIPSQDAPNSLLRAAEADGGVATVPSLPPISRFWNRVRLFFRDTE